PASHRHQPAVQGSDRAATAPRSDGDRTPRAVPSTPIARPAQAAGAEPPSAVSPATPSPRSTPTSSSTPTTSPSPGPRSPSPRPGSPSPSPTPRPTSPGSTVVKVGSVSVSAGPNVGPGTSFNGPCINPVFGYTAVINAPSPYDSLAGPLTYHFSDS